jgi:hypothetical protein
MYIKDYLATAGANCDQTLRPLEEPPWGKKLIFEFGTPIKLSDIDSKNISVPGNPAYLFIRILYPEFDSLRNCDRQNAIVDFDKVIRNTVEFSYFGATASRFELEIVGYLHGVFVGAANEVPGKGILMTAATFMVKSRMPAVIGMAAMGGEMLMTIQGSCEQDPGSHFYNPAVPMTSIQLPVSNPESLSIKEVVMNPEKDENGVQAYHGIMGGEFRGNGILFQRENEPPVLKSIVHETMNLPAATTEEIQRQRKFELPDGSTMHAEGAKQIAVLTGKVLLFAIENGPVTESMDEEYLLHSQNPILFGPSGTANGPFLMEPTDVLTMLTREVINNPQQSEVQDRSDRVLARIAYMTALVVLAYDYHQSGGANTTPDEKRVLSKCNVLDRDWSILDTTSAFAGQLTNITGRWSTYIGAVLAETKLNRRNETFYEQGEDAATLLVSMENPEGGDESALPESLKTGA